MEEVVEGVGYESELGQQVVDSKWSSVHVTEPIVPESELGTELVTVGSSYHLHKIVQMVLLVEVTEKMELTSRSSTFSGKFGQRPGYMARKVRSGSTVKRLN